MMSRSKEMERMQMKMMLTTLTTKVDSQSDASKVLGIKTQEFCDGNIHYNRRPCHMHETIPVVDLILLANLKDIQWGILKQYSTTVGRDSYIQVMSVFTPGLKFLTTQMHTMNLCKITSIDLEMLDRHTFVAVEFSSRWLTVNSISSIS